MVAQPPPWPRAPEALGAAACFLALSLWLCAPVLGDPTHLALGHPGNDIWNHLWGYWWVANELGRGELPVHTDLLVWPNGGSLWFIDTLNAVLTLPVQWAWGPVAAYNTAIGFNLWLAGFGAWLLARRVVGSAPGALVAGVAFATAPHLLGQVYNGISETVTSGWLALAVLAMREAVAGPTWRRGLVAGLLAGITTLASWYYGLFAGMVFGGLLLRAAWRALGTPILTHTRRNVVLASLAGGLSFGGLVAGPFALFSASMGATDAVVTRDERFVWMTLIMHNMTDVVSLIRPGKTYSPDLRAAFGEDLLVVVYLGASLLLPALWLMLTPMRRRAEPWLLLCAGFLVLTLGPFLYVGGAYVSAGSGWVPLPFLALFQWIPLFSRISHAYRFAVGATLALAVLSAWAVQAAPRLGLRMWPTAVFLIAARIAEALYFSPAVFPLPVSEVRVEPIYATLTGGAVIELPVSLPVLARSKTSMHQTVHGQPVPFGLNDPMPKVLYDNAYSNFLIQLERRNITYLPAELPWLDLAVGQAELVNQGARWVVLRRDLYREDQFQRVAGFLDATATVAADDGVVRVYALK